MLKRVLSLVLVLTLLLGVSITGIAAAQQPIEVFINGSEFELDSQAYLDEDGKVMVPIRQIAEVLDYEVGWDNEERSVSLSKGPDLLEFKIGEDFVLDEEVSTAMESVIKDGKSYVPLLLLDRGLDLIIGWDSKYQRLNINEVKENTEDFFKISDEEEIKANLRAYMSALEESNNFFASVLVARNGNVLLNEGYGFADIDQFTLNKSQTKHGIGSVTKQFVAMAIMQLSEEGLISLEDKVSEFFPDYPNGDLITIHNLLTHSSGLENYTNLPELFLNTDELESAIDVLNLVKDMPLVFNPGEEFSYSNTNYLMLGLVIEQLTHMSYEEYIHENIFKPLNLNDTGMAYGEINGHHDATAYVGYLDLQNVDDELLLSKAYGAGSMYSTVEDLYRWEQALATEKLVSSETLEVIFADHVDMFGSGYYGYGWMLADTPVGKMIYHGGNTLGFTADITRLIDLDMTIIILSNKGQVDLTEMKNNLILIGLGEEFELPKAKEIVELDKFDIYDSYTGKYKLLPEQDLDIIRVEDKLYAQVTGQVAFELFPESETQFFARIADVEIEFIQDDEGNINELVFTQGPLFLSAERIEQVEEKEFSDIDLTLYDDYVGDYELFPEYTITITIEGESIFAQVTDQDSFEIYPETESEFFYKVIDATITFVRDEDGTVTGLVLNQAGQELAANKID